MTAQEELKEFHKFRVGKFLISLGIVAGTALLQMYIPYLHVTYMLFFPAIILASIYGEGISAVILSAVASELFFTGHPGPFHGPGDFVNFTLFVMSGLLVRKIAAGLMEQKFMAKIALEELEREKRERDAFVATLTHDLQTPLTSAKLNAEMVLRNMGSEAMTINMTATVLSSLKRMELMIRDLLDVSQVKAKKQLPIELEEVSLHALLEDTVHDLVSIYGYRFSLKIECELMGLYSAPALKRVIENLCSNAVKYGDETGPVRICLKKNGEMALISVSNKGRVIPLEDQAMIFEPFRRSSTTSEGKKGWGLGLTLVRGLVDAHGGKVEVRSSEADGTTFSVFLPLDAPDLT